MVKNALTMILVLCGLLFGVNSMAFELSSSAFTQGNTIPKEYTCDGANISPPLSWNNVPVGTKSFVLILDDPDAPAGVWDHWVLFNIPPNVTALSADIKDLPVGTVEGSNSLNRVGYTGPCPPDREHRYFFKIYALNNSLSLNKGVKKSEVESAMQGHVLGAAELMGKYKRSK